MRVSAQAIAFTVQMVLVATNMAIDSVPGNGATVVTQVVHAGLELPFAVEIHASLAIAQDQS